jgi:hypothetical protein
MIPCVSCRPLVLVSFVIATVRGIRTRVLEPDAAGGYRRRAETSGGLRRTGRPSR